MGVFLRFVGIIAISIIGWGANAQENDIDTLIDALGIPEMLEIMQTESIAYGRGVGAEMLPDGGGETWQEIAAEIHDLDKMMQAVKTGFESVLGSEDIAPLVAFFTSDTGRNIIALEVSARRAFLDLDIEQAARRSYRAIENSDDLRLAQVSDYIGLNDLVEYNVVGAMNANYWFYRGLTAGEAFEMSDAEMLSEAWASEDETRTDTREWLFAYLLMAYAPLDDAQMAAYVALSKTAHGRALNRALFVAFDAMYTGTSYALGRAISDQLMATDL